MTIDESVDRFYV